MLDRYFGEESKLKSNPEENRPEDHSNFDI